MRPPTTGDAVGRGVYVHIPFCIVRCGYCDFNAYAGMDELAPAYVDALMSEVRARADGGAVATVFFGGGTPTQLSGEQLGQILRAIKDGFDVATDAEVTIEANPESVDAAKFESLREAGFNRVSIGVQSLSSHILAKLERVHSADRALEAICEASTAGFDRVNADLIYGTPGEAFAEWQDGVERILATARVDHISAYALTVEEGTPLHSWVERGQMPAPDEDDQAEKYAWTVDRLTSDGFTRYEVSNFARAGSWSRHNVNYWQAGNYVGLGAGAHSHSSGRRSWNLKSPQAYIRQAPDVEDGHEVLDPSAAAAEAAMLGIRLSGGIDLADFENRFSVALLSFYGRPLDDLIGRGILEVQDGCLKLSEQGHLLGSQAAMVFVGTQPELARS